MSQENVEIARAAHAEFERGNFWVLKFLDPSVRIEWLPVAGGDTLTVGLDAAARAMKAWMQPWEQVTAVAERVIDAGDRGAILAKWRGRGKISGVVTEWRYGSVWTLHDGKLTSIDSYTAPAQALRAVGL